MHVRCIFVLDIFNGEVVHAQRGERERYRPIHLSSRLVSSSIPLAILESIAPREVYVADLNSLRGLGENLSLTVEIASKWPTMADAGLSDMDGIRRLDGAVPVLGTETASLDLMERAASSMPIVASVDMLGRSVLARDPALKLPPEELIRRLNEIPLREVILLELDRVGTSKGIDPDFLRKMARLSSHPLLLGGGVKDPHDLALLESLGIEGALVATAVHNLSIPLEMIRD